MPFDNIPKSFVIHLVYICVMRINSFPADQGISKHLSPHEIVIELSLIFQRHAKVLFGSYVETNEGAVIVDTNRGRKFLGILLGPTGNIQGTQKKLISNWHDQKMSHYSKYAYAPG